MRSDAVSSLRVDTLVDQGRLGESMITNEPRMTSGGQRELRIIAPSSVPGYPLLVSVTIGADLVFAGWQNAAFWVGVTVSTLLLIILFLTHIAAKLLYAQALALRDLSHEKQRADSSAGELLRLSRLSTMQEMSSAIAHELNQPLAATANYLSVAAMRVNAAGGSDWARQSEALDKAQQQVQRAGEIIRRLRNFISRGKSEESRADIYGIIESAISLSLVRDEHADIALTCPKTTEKLYVQVDSIQIQQVLMNLIRNAVEAMENQSDKRLTIAAYDFGIKRNILRRLSAHGAPCTQEDERHETQDTAMDGSIHASFNARNIGQRSGRIASTADHAS